MRRILPLATLCCLAALPSLAETCVTPPYEGIDDPALADLLARSLPVVARYPSLDAALQATGPTICLSDGPSEALGFFEPDTNRVVIQADLDPDLQRAILIHELRHVEQFHRGLCPDLSLSMGAYAHTTWALEADATTISMIVAWDLRDGGDPGPWEALAALPRYAGMADVFAAEMVATGAVSRASAAAFLHWYAHDDRRDAYYIASCSAYLDAQDRTHALPQYGAIDGGFFDSLCVLPDGTTFPCAEPEME